MNLPELGACLAVGLRRKDESYITVVYCNYISNAAGGAKLRN